MGRTACTEPQCLYKGALYLYLYLYSPYGPYGLYRASVPVQRCTFNFTYTSTPPMGRTAYTEPQCLYKGAPLPLPIPLLPLRAVRPVQSLSACTTVHFTFTYTSTHPLGRTACTEPQCLYKGAPLPLPIPLLPLWAARPVRNLSACTRVHFNFTYAFYSISNIISCFHT